MPICEENHSTSKRCQSCLVGSLLFFAFSVYWYYLFLLFEVKICCSYNFFFCFPVAGGDPISRIRQAPHAGRVITELSSSGRTDQHSLSSVSAQNNTSRGSAQLYSSLEARVLPVGTDATEPLHGKESAEHSTRRETAQTSVGVDAHEFPTSNRAPEQAPAGEHTELNLPSATVTENEDAHMVDYMEHPFILSGERELPFIYLASLSAIWDAVQFNKPFIKGKIKVYATVLSSSYLSICFKSH